MHQKVESVINMFTVEKYSKGDVITKCGDPISRLVVIRSGQVSVWKHPEPLELIEMHTDTMTSFLDPCSFSSGQLSRLIGSVTTPISSTTTNNTNHHNNDNCKVEEKKDDCHDDDDDDDTAAALAFDNSKIEMMRKFKVKKSSQRVFFCVCVCVCV
jgi:hypothetical protein